jgi:hypothetical protein
MHETTVVHHIHDGGFVQDHNEAMLPVKGPHKHADTRCRGLVSLGAIPAAEIVIATPTVLSSRCEMECYRAVADNTPPGLYRPPNS